MGLHFVMSFRATVAALLVIVVGNSLVGGLAEQSQNKLLFELGTECCHVVFHKCDICHPKRRLAFDYYSSCWE